MKLIHLDECYVYGFCVLIYLNDDDDIQETFKKGLNNTCDRIIDLKNLKIKFSMA